MDIGKLMLEAVDLLGGIHENSPSAKEKELLRVAADALHFISTTGQQYEFEDYRQDLETEGPAQVIAAFPTREEAEAWLRDHPRPPRTALVLVDDEYHTVYHWRERNVRRLLSSPVLEFYLEKLLRGGLPPAVATFNTPEEARAWFHGLDEKPSQAILQIGGEHYLAAWHRAIGHLALHPFSIVQQQEG